MAVRLAGGTQSALRDANEERLLGVLMRRARSSRIGATRATLAEELGLSPAAINSLVAALAKRRLIDVAEVAPERARRGPAPRLCRLQPDAGYALALAVNHEGCHAVVTDLVGAPDWERSDRAEMRVEDDATVALRWLTDAAQRLAGDRVEQLVAIGISMAGPVHPGRYAGDPDRGKLRVGLSAMPGWAGINVGKELQRTLRWECPIVVENDAVLAALAEARWGAAGAADTAVYVKWDAGIGGGLIVRGEVYRAPGGISFEIGHLPVPDLSDRDRDRVPRCPACQRHCLQSLAGTGAMQIYAGRSAAAATSANTRELIRAAHRGDSAAADAIERAAGFLGRTLGGVLTELNPEMLIIGGDFGEEDYELFQAGVLNALREYAVSPAFRDVSLEPAKLGKDAPLRGAAALVLDEQAVSHLLARPEAARPVDDRDLVLA